jgi:hypothetical protein
MTIDKDNFQILTEIGRCDARQVLGFISGICRIIARTSMLQFPNARYLRITRDCIAEVGGETFNLDWVEMDVEIELIGGLELESALRSKHELFVTKCCASPPFISARKIS